MEAKTTEIGKKNVLRARAGEISLPKISGFAFGTGGVAADGTVLTPGNALRQEFLRKPIDNYVMGSDRCQYFCTLNSSEANGKKISEIGLCDSAENVVAIANFTEKGKDSGISMRFEIDDIM